jgi:hypothetical protein
MKGVLGFLAAICAILLLSGAQNASFVSAAIISLPILIWLTWRPQESPVLMFLLGYQWLQVATKALHAAVIGMDVRDMLPWAPVDTALWLGLLSLISLAGGMRVALQGMRSNLNEAAQAQARKMKLFELLKLHIGILIAVELLARTASFGGISQAVMAIGYLRFATLFMIGYAVVVQEKGYGVLLLVLLAEVAYSLGGFFAGFRLPLFVTLLAVASVPFQKSLVRPLVLIGLGGVTLYVGIIWQAVKNDYRAHVSQGSGEQVVLIDREEQWSKLSELVGTVNSDVLARGVEGMAVRFAYVDMFAFSIDYVPGTLPHTHGELLSDAIAHVFLPRMFFPNKAIIDDTAFTKKYTGLAMHSVEATSISLGYVAETYIDFGVPGMFFVTFGMGLFLGLCYRWMATYRVRIPVLRVALLTMLFLAVGSFETPLPKVLGGFLVPFILCALLVQFGELRIVRLFGRQLGLEVTETARDVQGRKTRD